MELAFVTYGWTGKLLTTYDMRQFKGEGLYWWNTLGKMLIPNKPLQLTSKEILAHFKRKLCSTKDILDIQKKFLTLKKGRMAIDEYSNAFTDNMEFDLHVVLDELNKIDRYSKRLPWEYYVVVKQIRTFEVAI